MTAVIPSPLVLVLLGWLAGGAANWAADVLPLRGAKRVANSGSTPPHLRQSWHAVLHFFTLPWYLSQHGLCPHCGERRPLRAPLLEAAMTVTFGLAWWRYAANPFHLAVICIYAMFLLAVLVIDFEHRRVLNVMLAPAGLVTLLVALLPGGPDLLQAVFGAALGFGIFMLLGIVSRGAIGAGDIKLAGVIGLMSGYPAVMSALVLGIVLGGAAAGVMLVTRRAGRKSTMAYAPYLAAGALVVLMSGM